MALHLADRTDREETMIRELESFCPGEWQVWPGVREDNTTVAISRGVRAIIAHADLQGWPEVLLLEDDVRFCSPRSRAHWDLCVSELPADWRLLLGGSYTHAGAMATPHLKKLDSFCSLHCALFRAEAYATVLRHRPEAGGSGPPDIDAWLGEQRLDVYLCEPQVAIQHNGYSDHTGMHANYDGLLTRFNLLS